MASENAGNAERASSEAASAAGAPAARFGVVLCGGQSRRMGSDKARLDLRGHSLLARAVGALEPHVSEVLLACGPRERYAELGHPLVLDRVADGGPLAGLEAALARVAEVHPEGLLCALACDMPRAEGRVFEHLIERLQEDRADLCLLASAGRDEPLFAVYHARALPAVRRALDRGQRRLISFHPELRVARLLEEALPPQLRDHDLARNLNTPEDLRREASARARRA